MTLIIDKATIKEFSAVSNQLEYDTLKPYIIRAEREYIIPEIGQDLYDTIEAFSQSSSSSSTSIADEELLERLQEAIINFALYLGFDTLVVNVSDAGIQRTETETSKTAYQYQELNLRNNFLESGYETLGRALEFLEDNKEIYTDWSNNATYYNRFKNLLVHTPVLFSDIFDIKNSWSVFFQIRSVIRKMEDFHISQVLGSDFLTEIKAEILDDDATNQTLIDIIRKSVVYLSLSDAALSKIVTFSKEGAIQVKQAGLNINNLKEPASTDKVSAFINQTRSDGEKYVMQLREHLNNNASASKYATYFESDLYEDPEGEDYSRNRWDNTEDGKSFTV